MRAPCASELEVIAPHHELKPLLHQNTISHLDTGIVSTRAAVSGFCSQSAILFCCWFSLLWNPPRYSPQTKDRFLVHAQPPTRAACNHPQQWGVCVIMFRPPGTVRLLAFWVTRTPTMRISHHTTSVFTKRPFAVTNRDFP